MTDSLQDKRVLVLGIARQGKALARWLPKQGASVTLSDQRDAGQLADDLLDFLLEPVALALGGHPVELLDETDILCVSGGVPLNLPIVQAAYARGITVTNDAILFLERCPAMVIGITGSSGKTTTTTLVGAMSKADGRKTWVGGNIGNVLLDDLDEMSADDTVVMELSSFQLEIAKTVSPDIAAVLNVTPNHLDRHGTLQAYAAAKANIFLQQRGDDLTVFGGDDLMAATLADIAPAHKAHFSMRQMVSDGAFLLGDRLAVVGHSSPTGLAKIVCERGDIQLRGEHNVQNVLAACALGGAAGISVDAMNAAIREFRGVEHRLEFVAEIGGVQWVNDSIATAPERVVAALRSFREPIILLAGGKDKNLPWDEMAALALERCRVVIAFGAHRRAIAEKVEALRRRLRGGLLEHVQVVDDLEAAVSAASREALRGEVVLLSPGGTSYDAYVDFAERGEHFRELVAALQG